MIFDKQAEVLLKLAKLTYYYDRPFHCDYTHIGSDHHEEFHVFIAQTRRDGFILVCKHHLYLPYKQGYKEFE